MVLICRICEAKLSGDKVVDVDGLYLWRKDQRVSESGANVVLVGVQSPPLTGWQSVTKGNHKECADKIPQVTAGLLVMPPSMKQGSYQVYILLRKERDLATVVAATCECAAG